jgi:hypothetical protein
MNMKNNRIIKSIATLITLLVVSGCHDFLDVNDTPNNPLTVTPAALLPTALAGTAFANANDLNRFASVTMDYLAGANNQPIVWDVYTTTGADFNNQWSNEIYFGALINYQKMIEAADRVQSKSYAGIGKIMKAYTFSIATDVWGDVPYSQALLGLDNTQPRLDSQEDIYKGNSALGITSLFDMVREGLADLEVTSVVNPGTDDIVYGGTLANWKRAGNTLLLKFALQISDREPALAASVINEVIAKNLFIETNAQNLGVKFGAATGSQSPIYSYTYVSAFRDDLIMSTRYVNRLQALNDPRLPLFVTAPTGSYVTMDNGFAGTRPTPSTNWSRWSQVITGANGVGPVRLITNAQRAFILAEAGLRIPGVTLPGGKTPNDYYQEGITASMTDAGMTAAQITAYFIANPTIASLNGTPANQLSQIITQKYIALTGNSLEAWNDWRRTGYPVFASEHQNAVGIDGTRPLRAVYINNEISRNPNFPTNIFQNVRVWWDVN